jgi:nicotinamide riboside kinase
MRWSKNKLKS